VNHLVPVHVELVDLRSFAAGCATREEGETSGGNGAACSVALLTFFAHRLYQKGVLAREEAKQSRNTHVDSTQKASCTGWILGFSLSHSYIIVEQILKESQGWKHKCIAFEVGFGGRGKD